MEHKTFEVDVKTHGESGAFEALASTWDVIDKGGDRMIKGAFTGTLEKWRESGKAIPVILSHQWDNLTAWVGKAEPRAVFEDDRGLVVQGQLFMDDENGRKVHKLMKEGLLSGWSFGYHVNKGGQRKGKDGANEITEVELFEVGPCLVGMNAEAQLQYIKADADPVEVVDPLEPAVEELREENAKANARIEVMLGELVELRKEHEELKKTSEVRRNEEPERAKSPPDSLKEESRKAVLAVMRDGVPARVESEPETPPEPPIDIGKLKEESRRAQLSVLKGGLDNGL